MIASAGLELLEYPYYDSDRREINFDAMMDALGKVRAGDVVLLHGCCHNPSGADLDQSQWQALAKLAQNNGFTPFIDTAYQGLAEGLDEDAFGLRLFADLVPEMIVAASCSKNFGLYRDRVGAVVFVGQDAETADIIASQAMVAARSNYSMPPAHGAGIVATILADTGLRQSWEAELAGVRNRIQAMRELLAERLQANAAGIDFSFITRQKGMFSFLGISPAQLNRLREEFAIYIVGSTRVNVAGINLGNIDYLCSSVCTVLES